MLKKKDYFPAFYLTLLTLIALLILGQTVFSVVTFINAPEPFSFYSQKIIDLVINLVLLVLLVLLVILIMRIIRTQIEIEVKSQFLRHTSHELKTPLTLISLYAETLISDEDMSPDNRKQCLQVISRESTALVSLVENLLRLSPRLHESQTSKLSEGDLEQLVIRSVAMSREWLRRQNIELKVNVAPIAGAVRFDYDLITHAFLNLIDNARKYGGNRGLIEIDLHQEKDKVILAVRDFGSGIPREKQKKIFDQFYRGTNARGRRGVGLGLYLVNRTMQEHNGQVELENVDPALGGGSVFKLVFPVSGQIVPFSRLENTAPVAAGQQPPPQTQASDQRRPSICTK